MEKQTCCGNEPKPTAPTCSDTCSDGKPEPTAPTCCGPKPTTKTEAKPTTNQCGMVKPSAPWVTGTLDTDAGPVAQIAATLTAKDRSDNRWARWSNKRRMNHSVPPGLYAIGQPDKNAPVLVTANYKMSFDVVRSQLTNRNVWLLILNTYGINVWCAAGKQTFGTDEIIKRIRLTGLDRIVSHKKIILPQLGAPGVAAHTVKKETGFNVLYGPVRADDIPTYLDTGFKTTPTMRRVTFPLKERLVLTPLELTQNTKLLLYIAATLLLLNLLKGGAVITTTLMETAFFAAAILTGAVLTPLLLPWLPGRSFALKGWIAGTIPAALFAALFANNLPTPAFYLLILPPLSSFLALNFTGASTYTNLSGVLKEMKVSIPLMIISILSGLSLKIYLTIINMGGA